MCFDNDRGSGYDTSTEHTGMEQLFDPLGAVFITPDSHLQGHKTEAPASLDHVDS